MLSNLHPAILLTRIITVFATTAVMPESNQQINAETGRAISTDRVMPKVVDMGIAAKGKSYFKTGCKSIMDKVAAAKKLKLRLKIKSLNKELYDQ